MIVVNLQQIGFVPHKFCDAEELAVVLHIAEEIMAATDADRLNEILIEWETALIWRSLDLAPVDDEWYYRALLLTCCRGLRGEIAPVFYTIP
jgi:hypothetical protein